MKRSLSLFLSLVLLLSLLTACGGGPSGGSESDSRSGGFGQSSSVSSSADASASGNREESGSGSSADASQSGGSSSSSDASAGDSSSSSVDNKAGIGGSDSSAPFSSGAQTGTGTQSGSAGAAQTAGLPKDGPDTFSLAGIPAFSTEAYVAVHNNVPYFDTTSVAPISYEYYAPLDSLGRCGIAYACVGQDIMPTEERGSIGQVKPSGWHTVRYDNVDGKYLYNRCHLVGYQLSAENANTSNLITGTRYLNIEGMLPFENMTADYVKESGNHVAYRVTPIFEGNNLVCTGVLMEGWSVEDQGDGICYCVFAYNAQPGITIDYATGDSALTGGGTGTADGTGGNSDGTGTGTGTGGGQTTPPAATTPPATTTPQPDPEPAPPVQSVPEPAPTPQGTDYILNTNTKKFHYPDCRSVKQMKESNKQYYTGSRDDIIAMGYSPCGNCNP